MRFKIHKQSGPGRQPGHYSSRSNFGASPGGACRAGLYAAVLCLIASGGSPARAQETPAPPQAQAPAEHPLFESQAPETRPAQASPGGPAPVAPTPAPASLELPPAKKDSAAPATAKVPEGEKRYVIGSLDVLYIRVWNNQNLTGPVDVRPDGMISLPLVGELKADGMTVAALKEAITAKLGEYLNSPEVDVQVARVNSKKYYILGGVNRPGGFALVGRTTVSEALSNAGGFRDFSNQKKIYVLRGTQKFNFNYKDVILGKHLEQDIQLENGDKIVVPE